MTLNMRAIEIINAQLQITERPVPKISNNEVLIKVIAAGINRPEIIQHKDLYPPLGISDIPEISAIVVQINSPAIKKGNKV